MIRSAFLLLILSFLASADISGTKTLTATTALNLDTGNTSSSGGDLLWNGSTLVPQGTAGIFNFLVSGSTGTTLFGSLTQSNLSVLSNSVYTSTGLGGASLVVGVVFGVHTNGGNYAKVLVTSNSGGSLGLQFVTFTSSTGVVHRHRSNDHGCRECGDQYSARIAELCRRAGVFICSEGLEPGTEGRRDRDRVSAADVDRRHFHQSDGERHHGRRDHVLFAGRAGGRNPSLEDAYWNGNPHGQLQRSDRHCSDRGDAEQRRDLHGQSERDRRRHRVSQQR